MSWNHAGDAVQTTAVSTDQKKNEKAYGFSPEFGRVRA